MAERPLQARPERAAILRQLRNLLPKLTDPLEVVAEQILGLESRIDFVARDRRGQVVLVFLAEPGSDLRLLADALAQRSWMEPRVADWLKLAPQLGLRPELGVRLLLLASRFDPRTIAAAKGSEGPLVDLGTCQPSWNGAGAEILLEAEDAPPPASAARADAFIPQFRTGLRAEDLGR